MNENISFHIFPNKYAHPFQHSHLTNLIYTLFLTCPTLNQNIVDPTFILYNLPFLKILMIT